ncbi:MAG TPA: hypothetical protein DIU35_01660 [Candidatus Latescibacteria bacterium]|nr:hypothetical protein [Gemmatimonadota bacterium]HCR16162.1 hypothetical protein [Candidatus Latescibacterota bacterium]|tara:strand:+ start:364 stop:600 length:237 start_codon:yes stop_codon:yes gene_type:complete
MAAQIRYKQGLRAGTPRSLFRFLPLGIVGGRNAFVRYYDVGNDGLFIKAVRNRVAEPASVPAPTITVVENWIRQFENE